MTRPCRWHPGRERLTSLLTPSGWGDVDVAVEEVGRIHSGSSVRGADPAGRRRRPATPRHPRRTGSSRTDVRNCAGAGRPIPRGPRPGACRRPRPRRCPCSGAPDADTAQLVRRSRGRRPRWPAGATRLAAPPITQPLSRDSGEVIDSTRAQITSMASSDSPGSRWDRQYAWLPGAARRRPAGTAARGRAPAGSRRRAECRSTGVPRWPRRRRRWCPDHTEQQSEHRAAVALRRQERHRRREVRDDGDAEFVGRRPARTPAGTADLRRLVQRPEDRSAEHHRADRVQVVLEGGDDAEVAAAAAQTPQQLRVVLGVTRIRQPSAVTRSAARRLSTVSPYERIRWPKPPLRVTPPMPVWLIDPPVVARPNRWVARSSSPQVIPPAARAVRRTGSTETALSWDRSIMMPSSTPTS